MNDIVSDNFKKAKNFLDNKEFDKAEDLLKENLKITNNNFETLFLLGSISGIKKNFSSSENYFKQAININPMNSNALMNLAIISQKLNKLEDAIDYFKKSLELNSKNVNSLCGIAHIFEKKNNLKSAKEYYQSVLDIDPNHHVANHSLGKLLLKLNKHREGLKLIQKVSGIIRFQQNEFKII